MPKLPSPYAESLSHGKPAGVEQFGIVVRRPVSLRPPEKRRLRHDFRRA